MSITTVQKFAAGVTRATQPMPSKSLAGSPPNPFAAMLSKISSGAGYSEADVKSFFAAKPSQEQIASQAANLGMNKDQIIQAMTVGGYGSGDSNNLGAGIDAFMADSNNSYIWSPNGAVALSKAVAMAHDASKTTERAMPASADIKAFYASAPSDEQVTAKVKSLGLNAAQMVQFRVAGTGLEMDQIPVSALESWYADSAQRLGEDVGGGLNIGSLNGGWTSCFSPTLGRAVTKKEVHDFFSTNPTTSEIFQNGLLTFSRQGRF